MAAIRTAKYATRTKRVAKSGREYYYYYTPIYRKLPTKLKETRKAIRRLALFGQRYKKVKDPQIGLQGLALLVYMANNNYPVRQIGAVFGFSHNYAHRNVKFVRYMRTTHRMFRGPILKGVRRR